MRRPDVTERTVTEHYAIVSSRYADFVRRLELWYRPAWNSSELVLQWVQRARPESVLEVGCGNRGAGPDITSAYPGVFYLGYDLSPEMVRLAEVRWGSAGCRYTSSITQVNDRVAQTPFGLGLALFTLHDHSEKDRTIRWVA